MSVAEIQRVVAQRRGLDPRMLRRKGKQPAAIAAARDEAIWLAREATGFSLPLLGRLFGGLHHTSVLAALRRAGRRPAPEPARTTQVRLREIEAAVAGLRAELAELRLVLARAGAWPPLSV